jgi:hypothetical protein
MCYSTHDPPHKQWLVGLEAAGVPSITLYVGVVFVPSAPSLTSVMFVASVTTLQAVARRHGGRSCGRGCHFVHFVHFHMFGSRCACFCTFGPCCIGSTHYSPCEQLLAGMVAGAGGVVGGGPLYVCAGLFVRDVW